MRTVLDQLITGLQEGPVALARIVSATGSAPSAVGTAMLVGDSGEVTGSLSAGCVDAAVVETAGDVLATGAAVLDEFGVDESGGFGVGLLCGGTVEVFVEKVEPARLPMLRRLRDLIGAGSPVALATTLSELPEWHLRETGNQPGRLGLDRDIDDLLAAGRSGIVGIAECDDPDGTPRPRTLVQTFASPRRLILVGANDFVRELAALGRQLGMRVTVVDARP
ncbi:MAG: XdhC family protein, partial [Gordonia amarae]